MQKTRIIGTQSKGAKEAEAHVHPFVTASGTHVGLLGLTERFIKFRPEFHPFVSSTFGTAMNQNVTFGGTRLNATIIHAGVNSGSAISGTSDVASPAAFELDDSDGGFDAAVGPGALVHNTATGTFAIVTAVNSDIKLTLSADIMQPGNEAFVINDIWPGTAVQGTWNFADASHIWRATEFTAFTGKIDLDVYNPANNSIILEFGLDGIIVGNSVDLNNFIDTGDFGQQNFVIPKDALGLATQNFNSMRITITRIGGAKPTVKFDDFQWENAGDPAIFKATTPLGTRFHITEIRLRFEDAISAVLTDGSMPNIDPGALFGVSSLSNGITFSSVQKGKNIFAVNLKNFGDFFATGSDATNITGNGTNSGVTLVVMFPEPII